MDVSFYVQERHVFEGLEPFPWMSVNLGWKTLSAACQAMEGDISKEQDRRTGADRGFMVEFRIVKVTTVVVCKDDDNINYARAGGDCICESCGKKFYDHPMAEEILGWKDLPWLHRLCDGRLVKL